MTRGFVRLASPADHEAIHRLNYRTFVEEIPQHPPNVERRLVDRFHDENCYAVYEVGGEIVGMVAARTARPFSLEQKLGSLDQLVPGMRLRRPIEMRLLSVEPRHRSTRAFTALVGFITRHFLAHGYDLAVISGTTRQLSLYRHLGFEPFGSLVGRDGAWYQPMYVTSDAVARWPDAMFPVAASSFLPGPVELANSVHEAFRAAPASHRAEPFRERHAACVDGLRALTGARYATMLMGSGTLANDVVAAGLARLGRGGIVATNGEFGDRLVDHARRAGLAPLVVASEWGEPLDYERLEETLRASAHGASAHGTSAHGASAHGAGASRVTLPVPWIWLAHCETSTGVLNDLALVERLAARHGARVAVDAISSIGTVPVDLSRVHLASGVSGKALGAYPGLSFVLHDELPARRADLPRYLDLGLAHEHDGVPFTQSSNLVSALHAALHGREWPARYAQVDRAARELREALGDVGARVLARAEIASPGVLTIVPEHGECAQHAGRLLAAQGWLLSFESGYLRERDWLQVCLMGEWHHDRLVRLPRALRRALDASRRAGAMRGARASAVADRDDVRWWNRAAAVSSGVPADDRLSSRAGR